MQFEVGRADLHRTRLVDEPVVERPPGSALLRVDTFALTSNNITYAAFGDAMQYWNFFPPADDDAPSPKWGRIPVWGFADVVESDAAGLDVGRRVYGYLPMATELVVIPGRVGDTGFVDTAAHRQPMPGTYNRYAFTDTDPIYAAGKEYHQMVLWPLFFTSFLIDDFLADNAMFGASTVVLSSASSKTSIGTASLLAEREGVRVVGLTSSANAEFVRALGCYDETVVYGDAVTLDDATGSVYIDVAGNADVTVAVHARLGDQLRYSMIVGDTHWDHEADAGAAVAGPPREFFFAPTQIAKRTQDWGAELLDERVGEAWHRYSAWVDRWIEFERCSGPQEVERAYRTLLDGRVDPRIGYACSMQSSDD